MQVTNIPKKWPIKVISKPADVAVVIKHPTGNVEHPQKGINHPKGFHFLWLLVDLYIVEKGHEEGYFIPDVQLDSFEKDPIVLRVDLPEYIHTNPGLKPDTLRLIYYDKLNPDYKWQEFEQQDIDWETHTLDITLTEWIKDPPLGWGGDHPT